jgi:hypothetical protein
MHVDVERRVRALLIRLGLAFARPDHVRHNDPHQAPPAFWYLHGR